MELNKKLIGIRIMQQRKASGLTQEALAEKLNISKNHLSGIECGKYMPTTKFILKLCDVLGGTPDYYLIGNIMDDSDNILNLVKRLPGKSQAICCRLIEVYLKEFSNDDIS